MPTMIIVVMIVPVYFGRHLPRSELLIILDSGGGAGIDQRRRTGLLGGRDQNQQRCGCGKAQNSRHGHDNSPSADRTSLLTGQSSQLTRRATQPQLSRTRRERGMKRCIARMNAREADRFRFTHRQLLGQLLGQFLGQFFGQFFATTKTGAPACRILRGI
jgi:hypothetical protein